LPYFDVVTNSAWNSFDSTNSLQSQR